MMHSIAANIQSFNSVSYELPLQLLSNASIDGCYAGSVRQFTRFCSTAVSHQTEILESLLHILTSQCNSTLIRKYQALLEVFGARRSLNVIY